MNRRTCLAHDAHSALHGQPGLPAVRHRPCAAYSSIGGWARRRAAVSVLRAIATVVLRSPHNRKEPCGGSVSAVHRLRNKVAITVSTSEAFDDAIAQFADGAVAARSREDDVGCAEDVAMRVRNSDRTTDDSHATEVVDVVADVHDVRVIDSAFGQQTIEKSGFVVDALFAGESEFPATRPDGGTLFLGEHQQLDAQAAEQLETEPVAPVARDPLVAVLRDPYPVVCHDAVEVEDHKGDAARERATAARCHHRPIEMRDQPFHPL